MIATAVEATLLVRHSTSAVADAFVASRLPSLPFKPRLRQVAARPVYERPSLPVPGLNRGQRRTDIPLSTYCPLFPLSGWGWDVSRQIFK